MKLFLKAILLGSVLSLFCCKAAHQRKDAATNHIDQLQAGALMVKLKTSENKIAKLKEMGNMEAAKKAIKEQQTTNKYIINAFKTKFDFCPVYFFHSNDVSNVKNNDFEGSVFQTPGEDLKNPPPTDTYFLIGEVDYAYQDELASKNTNEPRKVAGVSGKTAVVIRDRDNFQIPSPFPFRVSLSSINENSLLNAVGKLNDKLKRFDNKMERRKLKRRR